MFDNMPQGLGKFEARRDVGLIESGPLVDSVLLAVDDDIVAAIYKSDDLAEYFAENGVEILDFGGGEKGITAESLVGTPISVLRKAKKSDGKVIGLRNAKRVISLCKEAIEREPHY